MPDAHTTRLRKRLLRYIGRVNQEFGLIEAGDRIMVGVSGGKDSYALMWLLSELQRKAPLEFSIIGVNLDQGHPGFPAHVIEGWFQEHGFEYKMLQRDTYSIVLEKIPEGRTYCSLCSRLRRGILYTAAEELGCNKIALGHHRDDLIETVMLNLLYSGQLKSMPPKLFADDGRNVVIRPLAYAPEEEIAEYAQLMGFPVVPCDLCGSQENLKRQQVKAMLGQLQAANPKVKGNMLAALGNVRVSHLLDQDLLALRGLPAAAAPGEDPLSAL